MGAREECCIHTTEDQCEREGRHGYISIELKNKQFSLSIGDS